jgi:hypothetical protein
MRPAGIAVDDTGEIVVTDRTAARLARYRVLQPTTG